MLIDILDLITPSAQFRATSYKFGNTPSICYVSSPDADGILDVVEMKGLTGEPWDWMRASKSSVKQLLTENIWSDPSSGKIYLLDGAPRFPRFIDYSPNQSAGSWALPDLHPPQTNYIILGAGAKPTGSGSNGIVRCTFSGPFPGAAIGDLLIGQDWLLS